MKTLNRTLSLVLVLVMVLGLFGVASAKFTDDATIQYKEAVGVAVGIGAIDGYADGTFNPTGDITREEAAKLISYAILGPNVAKTLTVSNTGFKDVAASRWSAPFISYLVNKGIINGMGDGTFNPTGKVTGYQLGKMLLTAAGYGKNGEYTGNSWELNTAVDAGRLGVFTGSKSTNYAAPATREEAALYVFNGLTKVGQVSWSKTNERYEPHAAISGDLATIAREIYGLNTATGGTIVTGMITGSSKSAGKTLVTIAGVPTDKYVYTPELSQYGHTYAFYTGSNNAVYYAEQLSTAYTVPATVNTAAKLYNALGSVVTWVDKDAVPQFVNNALTTALDPDGTTTAVTDDAVVALSGLTIIVKDKVITAVITKPTVTLNKVSGINTTLGSESITLSTIGLLSNGAVDNVVEYAGIAKDDIVLASNLSGGKYALTKVTPVTGVYSSKSVPSSGATTYTVGGVAYKASDVADNTGLSLVVPASMVVGTEYKIYLDAAGNLIGGVGASATVSNYAYVAQFGQTSVPDFSGAPKLTLVADIYFADGTHNVYPIDVTTASTAFTGAVYDTATATKTTVRGLGVYDVTIASNGKAVIKLPAGDTAVGATGTTGKVDLDEISVTKGISKIGQDTQVLYADAKSIAFHVTGTYGTTTGATAYKVTVLSGIANFVSDSTSPFTQAFYKTVNGIDILTAAVSTNAVVAPVTENVVFFNGQYADNSTLVNGEVVTVRTYTVYTDGVASTVEYKSGAQTAAGFYTTGGTDLTAFSTNVSTSAVNTISYFGGTLTLATVGDVLVNGDTVIVDMTPTKAYTALVESGKTISVWVEYSVSATSSIKTAETIYVTSIS